MSINKLTFEYPSSDTLLVKLSGDWKISEGLPAESEVISQLDGHKNITRITFDLSDIGKWDSGLASFLFHLVRECRQRKITINHQGLPAGVERLISLALKVHEMTVPRKEERAPFLESLADKVLHLVSSTLILLDFLGEITVAFGRLIKGKAYFRRDELISILRGCGADAFALVSLISLLVGMILAFIGAIQLRLFGAQIYIANIVGIAMVRVMGAVMTGVLMSGRTGASFAAELGLMQTNEEIDALKTLGISPVEFLVMPRVLALVIMMPLLTVYADFMGILGGLIVGSGLLGLNPVEYWQHTQSAVKLNHLWVGLIHSFVFGIIVAVAGCLRGIKCARSAEAVGQATTSAVVSGITGIVIATAIITFVCQVLGV
ncbi:MAG: ABC transporter permease [Candidatus Omnitrophica bacterium]|nr:ABC transporter permease [Candidatus Omnitrophota bacterium]